MCGQRHSDPLTVHMTRRHGDQPSLGELRLASTETQRKIGMGEWKQEAMGRIYSVIARSDETSAGDVAISKPGSLHS